MEIIDSKKKRLKIANLLHVRNTPISKANRGRCVCEEERSSSPSRCRESV